MPFSRSTLTSHWRALHTPDSILELARDGSNYIYIKEKTSAEDVIKLLRRGANCYQHTRNLGVPIQAKTADYTLSSGDCVLLVSAAAGAVTVTLPPAGAKNGWIFRIKKTDSSANAVVVDGDGAETIDGAATFTLSLQYESVSVVCDGTGWYII